MSTSKQGNVQVENQRVFALLIDGDNISTENLRQIWDQLKTIGELRIKKVFCIKATLDSWEEIHKKYAIQPNWVPNNTPKKNSVDIALVIEAMKLGYERPEIEGFCIVSTDSDYTGLATHLKQRGKYVLGIGKENTPEAFRAACDKFDSIDKLSRPVVDSNPVNLTPTPPEKAQACQGFRLMIEAYEQAMENTSNQTKGWISLPDMKAPMANLNPEIKPNLKQLAEGLKTLAKSFPTWFEVHEQSDSKPVVHQARFPKEAVIYKYLAAYIDAVKVRKLGDGGWVQLSALGESLKELFPNPQRISYKSVSKPQKVIEKMSADNADVQLRKEGEHPEARFDPSLVNSVCENLAYW